MVTDAVCHPLVVPDAICRSRTGKGVWENLVSPCRKQRETEGFVSAARRAVSFSHGPQRYLGDTREGVDPNKIHTELTLTKNQCVVVFESEAMSAGGDLSSKGL